MHEKYFAILLPCGRIRSPYWRRRGYGKRGGMSRTPTILSEMAVKSR